MLAKKEERNVMVAATSGILAIIFYIVSMIGGFTQSFYIISIGFSVASVSIIVFAFTFNKHSMHIREKFRGKRLMDVVRVGIFAIGAFTLFVSSTFWRDLPYYTSKEYAKLEGVPSNIVYISPRNAPSGIDVTVNGETIYLTPPPYEYLDELDGKRFVIYYLPHSEWIIDYYIEVDSDEGSNGADMQGKGAS